MIMLTPWMSKSTRVLATRQTSPTFRINMHRSASADCKSSTKLTQDVLPRLLPCSHLAIKVRIRNCRTPKGTLHNLITTSSSSLTRPKTMKLMNSCHDHRIERVVWWKLMPWNEAQTKTQDRQLHQMRTRSPRLHISRPPHSWMMKNKMKRKMRNQWRDSNKTQLIPSPSFSKILQSENRSRSTRRTPTIRT